jgi:phosphoglycolate phosphatase
MIRAIIFDFDGTLADTIPAIREGLNATMRHYGYPEHSLEAVRSFINFGARQLVRQAMPAALQGDEALLDEVLEVYEENYGQTYLQTNVTYEGLDALVRELHDECGMRIGVLSNKEHPFVCNLVEQVLDAGVCEAVQGNIPDKPSKPDPYLSRRVAEALGVATEECVMVGDSDVDIRTAKNAGMLPVSVSWGYRDADFLRERGAEYVVSTPQELRALLLRLIEQN